ncbi:murein hydrolase activator EnvC [Rhizobium sp. S95]|uniref:Murein hydrolase activator EnvC n=1 Tax=Ciceribacter sichuanensis TaxID=2949647 RepID=A0AAJ1BXV5_9HYPH|nr:MULTISPECIES: murein hydrolase activator EnvC [unclassified Ciceribacter]MCM2396414.1 murein hydrolase activator EnvC [Ciceribacter sp. S95]MCO5957435.1 murein hydrolase activator EnvC [Ciceribacter sp. S101]
MRKAAMASGRRLLRAGAGGALVLAAVMAGHVLPSARAQEPAEPADPAASAAASPATPGVAPSANPAPESGADDAAQALRLKRDQIGRELQELSRSMQLSQEKSENLQQSISAIAKTSESLKSALIESASRRKDLERKMAEGERKLADFGIREDRIRHSFKERRAVLAEVLAALQRMGRNPPPALLVSPDDALASVRTAILLGAVVPGVRKETDRLAADLQELMRLRDEGQKEMTNLVATMQSRQEEERRMDLLLVENDRLSKQNAEELDAERRRAEQLAERASTMEGLIASLESETSSVREAAEAARAEEDKRRQQTEEQKQKARELALSTLPDKNRIAPAYPFSELKQKLELPVAGDVLRQFGDPDGTGHPARGMVIAASAGALVTAPADAWVVFAGEFRSYGQMVILNTGDGYHVVLSGMDRISTSQGKFVLSGEPLAVMGEKRVASATGLALETDRPTLYIEFRKDGKPVDSRPWWTGNDSGKADNGT